MKFDNYKLYQNKNSDFHVTGKEKIKDYDVVYSGKVSDFIKTEPDDGDVELILEILFRIFNIEHPVGYKGRSLSVGDIVQVDNLYFICDSFGWKKIKGGTI